MEYTFRSFEKTVYLELPYKLVINSSSGVALDDNGNAVLTASVIKTSDGSDIEISENSFTWTRHELSDSFDEKTGSTITVTKDDLVDGSGTFVCTCTPSEFYWKDTALISIEETISGPSGQNAPYQRTVYKVSKDKPERPSGNASELPSGWSLQPPPRTNNWKIWASVSYVTFDADNKPIYSEWSDPVEWTGEASPPIVQWQWGDSSEYPPHVTKAVMVIDGDLVVFSEEGGSYVFIDNDDLGWSDSKPDKVEGYPYLWKREYNYQHTSDEDEWFYYCVNGVQGFDGTYQSIGYIVVGTNSVIFAGLDEDKNPTLPIIHIFIEDLSYYFDSITATLNEKSDSFYLVAKLGSNGFGSLSVAYLSFMSDGTTARSVWKDHSTDEVIEDGFVLATIRMNGASIRSVTITIPTRFAAYEKVNFMELLNGRDMDDINVAAEAMGVERVFTRVAALEAFVDALYANIIHFINAIYAGSFVYDKETGTFSNPTNGPGVLITADGRLQAVNAFLTSLQATKAKIEGEFETSDSQGIILKSSKNQSSLTVTDTDTRYVMAKTDSSHCLAEVPAVTSYVKLSGYSQKFMNGADVLSKFDGNFPRDGAFSGGGYSYTP